MQRVPILLVTVLVAVACGDTDTDGARAPETDAAVQVEPVDLDTLAWYTESRPVEFGGRMYLPVDPPVQNPVVDSVGTFEGTPLYVDADATIPYDRLLVPLEQDYWKVLELGPRMETDSAPDSGP
ncbi:MAG: hypothetical protein ACOC5I_02085 [Gemmatimonadota bacterium]